MPVEAGYYGIAGAADVKVVIEHDGTLEIRPESPFENYALRKWHEDWRERRVVLRVSYKDDNGEFTKDVVDPP